APEKLHCKLLWRIPRTPVPLLSATFWPREGVCAVPYSQLSPEPPTASSLHCWRAGCVPSIAQKDVTIAAVVSVRPTRSPAPSACSSSGEVQAWVPGELLLP